MLGEVSPKQNRIKKVTGLYSRDAARNYGFRLDFEHGQSRIRAWTWLETESHYEREERDTGKIKSIFIFAA